VRLETVPLTHLTMIQISVVRVVILPAPFSDCVGQEVAVIVFWGVISAALIVAIFIFESFDELFFYYFSLVSSDQRFPLCGTPWARAPHFCVSPRAAPPDVCRSPVWPDRHLLVTNRICVCFLATADEFLARFYWGRLRGLSARSGPRSSI
jgi:hypothetical protein